MVAQFQLEATVAIYLIFANLFASKWWDTRRSKGKSGQMEDFTDLKDLARFAYLPF